MGNIATTPRGRTQLRVSNELALCNVNPSNRITARVRTTEYIEVFYNRQRPHSSLRYRTAAQAWADTHNPAAQTLTNAA